MSKWTKELEDKIIDVVGEDTEAEVSLHTVADLAEAFDFSDRSVAAKLRNMGYSVEKVNNSRSKTFSDEQEAQLIDFVEKNKGLYTYAEIAAHLFGDEISGRQVQGKLLSLELTDCVKPAEHVEVPKKFTEAEEDKFVKLAEAGAFLEDIADAIGKEINTIRGKALSLLRAGKISVIPKQRDVKVAESVDPLADIEGLEAMSVADIAELIGKSERGVKTMLTRRGITVADYNGEKKRAKQDAKKEEAA